MGRRLLEKEARQFNISLKKISDETMQRVAAEYGCGRVNDLYAALGYGKWSARQVLTKATGQPLEGPPVVESQPRLVSTFRRILGLRDATISVRGHDDLMVYRSKCCNPIPGDEIVGYVTRGRGVAVHSNNCPNVRNLLYDTDRKIDVEWAGKMESSYPVRLRLRTEDRPGMLAAVTAAISDASANIRNLESAREELHARIEFALDVRDRRQLEQIVARIKKITGVFGIERIYNG
jgi:guanosine-3',5'-bis(diphosphate) 3'-pyrophosphohydrolase